MALVNIEYVTHASLLLDNEETRLLMDPFYFMDPFMGSFMCHFPPRDLSPDALGAIDYIFSSHIHPDHCHKNTLAQLRDQVTNVLLPSERRPLVDLYVGLGYPNPMMLDREKTVKLSERISVTAYWDGSVDTAAVFEIDGCTILHQNDCRLSPKTLEKIASRHRVDFAFLLYTSCQSLFPFILDRPMAELECLAEERERGLMNYQASCVEILRPKVVVPYSMTMTFTGREAMFVNTLWRYTPQTFCEALRARCPSIDCIVLHPGDRIEWSCQGHRVMKGARSQDYWGKSQHDYIRNVSSYLETNRDRLPSFDWGSKSRVMGRLSEQVAARVDRPAPDCIGEAIARLRVRDAWSSETLEVDFGARRVSLNASVDNKVLFTMDIPASVVEALLDGSVDPFVALYTHHIRFELHARRDLAPEEEGMIYLESMLFLFAKKPASEIAETDGMRLARKGSPHLSTTWTTIT